MNHSPDREPLTPEERALAQRLARIGPHDGPSPALDAKILAAAHAAVGHVATARASEGLPPSRRRRWPTALGVAASLVVVVGLAWQMQPMLRSPPPIRGPQVTATPMPSSGGELSADVLAPATPLARSAVQNPPPPPTTPAVPARSLRAPPPATAVASSPAPTAAPAARHFVDEAVPALSNGADTASPAVAEVYAPAPPAMAAPASPPPPPPPMQIGQNRMAAPQAFPERAAREAAARAEVDAMTARRKATSAEGALRSAAAAPALQDQPAKQNDTALDRIEVTGSRVARADDNVGDDRALEPAAWMQRIRERRDEGDIDAARASLALFRKAHPRVRLPADLRALTP